MRHKYILDGDELYRLPMAQYKKLLVHIFSQDKPDYDVQQFGGESIAFHVPNVDTMKIEEALEWLERHAPGLVVQCYMCKKPALKAKAHRHQEDWIGDHCCWDERLRSSE